MAEIVLTGATGLIGSRLLRTLEPGRDVLAVARNPPAGAAGPGVRWLRHDLARPGLPSDLPPEVGTIVHLAQSRHYRSFPHRADDIFAVNVGSTLALIDYAWRSGAERFVYASSGAVYGHAEAAFREDDLSAYPRSLGFYAASKQSAELLLEAYETHLTVVILRFFFVYGRGQGENMLIPRLVSSVADGRPIALQGEQGIRLNPVHVDDAAAAIARSLELTASERINVAGSEVLSIREIGGIIGRAVRRDPVFEVDASAQPGNLIGDIAKMRSLLVPPVGRFAERVTELCR